MAKRRISDLPVFDAAEHLDTEEAQRAYLSAILEEGDTELFLQALGDVAKAKGMSEIAEKSGLGRESLYKAFAPGKKPQFETVFKVARAAGLEIRIL
ncbi:putative addiction module antidote protein [Luminiphilus syltensis NOR5-1B]|uniref:Putative addiction module antidote protein n=1 Tax=Luminiphilus syltensis NOR5-1B TaxID=565045 RepID=B8KUY3_9GAMM|nr:addiction module antidote protein [Luminiphilus syltensis]EED36731.1 putative addiction module antidote protein [Luminiphilus syltensis NOR5-1B]